MDRAAGTAVRTTIDPPDAVVSAVGDLDVAAVPGLADALDRVLAAGATAVVVELGEAAFVGAAGLGVLCVARERLLSAGGTLTVRTWSPAFSRVCEAAGLSETFGLAA